MPESLSTEQRRAEKRAWIAACQSSLTAALNREDRDAISRWMTALTTAQIELSRLADPEVIGYVGTDGALTLCVTRVETPASVRILLGDATIKVDLTTGAAEVIR